MHCVNVHALTRITQTTTTTTTTTTTRTASTRTAAAAHTETRQFIKLNYWPQCKHAVTNCRTLCTSNTWFNSKRCYSLACQW
eukprot:21327-Heterococcus_DN1.PRE.1